VERERAEGVDGVEYTAAPWRLKEGGAGGKAPTRPGDPVSSTSGLVPEVLASLLSRMMNEPTSSAHGSRSQSGNHLTTISHEGRFWDVYLELDDDARQSSTCRGLLAFSPAGGRTEDGLVRTTVLFIEDSYEEVLRKARSFDMRQLEALLRSALP